MRTRPPRLLLPLALALLLLTGAPSGTDASCATAPSTEAGLAAADVVFIGTVADVSRRDSTATFAVDEVWRGDALPAVVTVHGAAENAPAEDDRAWRLGGRYLVAATNDGGTLRDTACSASQPWTDALAALRPADAHPPVDQTPTSGPPGDPPYALVFLLIVAGGALGAFLLLRHR